VTPGRAEQQGQFWDRVAEKLGELRKGDGGTTKSGAECSSQYFFINPTPKRGGCAATTEPR